MNAAEASAVAGSVLAGVSGGMLFVFTNAVMGALGAGPAAHAIRTMQRINARVINPLFLGALFGPALLGAVAVFLGAGRGALAASLLYAGALGVTILGNVPLNDRLDRVAPDAPDADAQWAAYARPWVRLNNVRSALAVVAAAAFISGVG